MVGELEGPYIDKHMEGDGNASIQRQPKPNIENKFTRVPSESFLKRNVN